METKTFLEGFFKKNVKTSVENLSDEQQMDERAFLIMECIKRKVSPTLFNMLCEMLYGFRKEVQQKTATNLRNFVCSKVATTTGVLAVDTALEICYVLIGAERKQIQKPITNSLLASKLIEYQQRKTQKEAREQIKLELPRVKNPCGIEIRKSCTTCMHRCEDDEECQMCKLTGVSVDGIDLCSGWKMAEGYQQAGRKRGKIKKKEYLMFVQMQREQEHKAIKQGILKEEECKTSEELRAMYEEEFGNIYEN